VEEGRPEESKRGGPVKDRLCGDKPTGRVDRKPISIAREEEGGRILFFLCFFLVLVRADELESEEVSDCISVKLVVFNCKLRSRCVWELGELDLEPGGDVAGEDVVCGFANEVSNPLSSRECSSIPSS
tara:strand:- start:148 stop:531 length:384 start_codon:yes stop_codon:yes gene_type:complete